MPSHNTVPDLETLRRNQTERNDDWTTHNAKHLLYEVQHARHVSCSISSVTIHRVLITAKNNNDHYSINSSIYVIYVKTVENHRNMEITEALIIVKCCDFAKMQKLQKVILFSSTLTHSQCDAGNITFCNFCCFRCARPQMLPLTSV